MMELIYGILYIIVGFILAPALRTPKDVAGVLCFAVGGAFLLVGLKKLLERTL